MNMLRRLSSFFLTLFLLFIIVFLSGLLFIPQILTELTLLDSAQNIFEENISDSTKEYSTSTLLFVGDVMLARGVESRILSHGFDHLFAHTKEYISNADLSVLNFEGIVPPVHTQTESMQFRFSVDQQYIPKLKEVGFDVFSLANNHSSDFGTSGFGFMQSICVKERLICRGIPSGVASSSTFIFTDSERKVGLIFIHTLFSAPSTTILAQTIKELESETDKIFIFVHWGAEYELLHSNSEENLAHSLIDLGADAIIGHHPHVVQDIELYKGRPIFYSLGNFVFDQYFSDDVREGLMLTIELTEKNALFTAIPVETYTEKAAPRLMTGNMRKELLERTFSTIRDNENVNSFNGTIALSFE